MIYLHGDFNREQINEWFSKAGGDKCLKAVEFSVGDGSVYSDLMRRARIKPLLDDRFIVMFVHYVDQLNEKIALKVKKLKDRTIHPIVLIGDSINKRVWSGIQSFQLGNTHQKFGLVSQLLVLFRDSNRDRAFDRLTGIKISKYFLDAAMFNAPLFYDNGALEITVDVLLRVACMQFKVSTTHLLRYLVFALPVSEARRKPRFPEKIDLSLIE